MDAEADFFIRRLDEYIVKIDKLRFKCFQILQKAIFDYYEGAYNIQALVFGSVSSGLALEESDMDIAFKGMPVHSKEHLLQEFTLLKVYLEKSIPSIISVKPITSSKVPILKLLMQCEKKEIKIDVLISEDYDCSSPYMRCLHSVEMTKDILNKFSHCREIVLLLKKLLNIRGLNSTYKGGLSSYALVLMVATFLNHFPYISSIIEQLINIMQFYGGHMNIRNTGISPILYFINTERTTALMRIIS